MWRRIAGTVLAATAAALLVFSALSMEWWQGNPREQGTPVLGKVAHIGLIGGEGCFTKGTGRCVSWSHFDRGETAVYALSGAAAFAGGLASAGLMALMVLIVLIRPQARILGTLVWGAGIAIIVAAIGAGGFVSLRPQRADVPPGPAGPIFLGGCGIALVATVVLGWRRRPADIPLQTRAPASMQVDVMSLLDRTGRVPDEVATEPAKDRKRRSKPSKAPPAAEPASPVRAKGSSKPAAGVDPSAWAPAARSKPQSVPPPAGGAVRGADGAVRGADGAARAADVGLSDVGRPAMGTPPADLRQAEAAARPPPPTRPPPGPSRPPPSPPRPSPPGVPRPPVLPREAGPPPLPGVDLPSVPPVLPLAPPRGEAPARSAAPPPVPRGVFDLPTPPPSAFDPLAGFDEPSEVKSARAPVERLSTLPEPTEPEAMPFQSVGAAVASRVAIPPPPSTGRSVVPASVMAALGRPAGSSQPPPYASPPSLAPVPLPLAAPPSSSSSLPLPLTAPPTATGLVRDEYAASLPAPDLTTGADDDPVPACPNCESPMFWVEEHLRFYCKSCRMYF